MAIVLLVFIYNILTIGFGTLCFMHLVSGRSLNIFLANFFLTGRVMSQPVLLRFKKFGFGSGIFRVGLG